MIRTDFASVPKPLETGNHLEKMPWPLENQKKRCESNWDMRFKRTLLKFENCEIKLRYEKRVAQVVIYDQLGHGWARHVPMQEYVEHLEAKAVVKNVLNTNHFWI